MRKTFFLVFFCIGILNIYGQAYTIENNQIKTKNTVQFIANDFKLTEASIDALNIIATVLKEKTYISTLRVEGHYGLNNNEKTNQDLSEKRALEVCNQLIALGVDCKRLLPVGFGSTKPIATNTTDEGKKQNERIVFVVAAIRNKAIGGMSLDGGGKTIAAYTETTCH